MYYTNPPNAEKLRKESSKLKMRLVSATYLKDYKIELLFDDKKKQLIDFLSTLKSNPVCKKYLDMSEFMKFKIEEGNLVWGKNWEMIFTVESLYNNSLNKNKQHIK